MNRRKFLEMLGVGAAMAAAPKLIFDMGKNSRLYALAERDRLLKAHPRLIMPSTEYDVPENIIFTISPAARIYQLAELDRLALLDAHQIKELADLIYE